MEEILSKVKSEILVPVVELLFVLALVYFLWGVVQFIMHSSSPDGRKDGQQHMLWGIIGLAIMFSVFGIMNLIFCTVTDCNSSGGQTTGINNQPITEPGVIKQGL